MKKRDFGTIIQIGDVLVSEDVVMEFFSCDYEKCKGCCCIIGDSGAPLEESELEPLEQHYPTYSPLMSEAGRKAVDEKGFFEIDRDGDLVTPVVPGRRSVRIRTSTGRGTASARSNAVISKDFALSGNRFPVSSIRSGSSRWAEIPSD